MDSPHKLLAARVPALQIRRSRTQLESRPLLLYVLIISLCAFPLGWDLGTTGNLMDLPSFRARLGVSARVIGVLISSFNLGCICGCVIIFAAKPTRKLGHLSTFRACLLVFLFGAVLSFCGLAEGPSSIYLYSIGRVFQGISAGASCVVGPVFISHLCTFSKNGVSFLALFQIVVSCFVFLGNCLFAYTGRFSELIFCIISTAMPIFALVCSLHLPESPREARVFSDPKKFRDTLTKLLYDWDKGDNWVHALHVLKFNNSEKDGHLEEKKISRGRLMMCCFLSILQQTTGANYFFYFGKAMFDQLMLVKSPVKFSGLLLSICNLTGTIASCFLVRSRGARIPLFYGSINLCLLLFTFASMGSITSNTGTPFLGAGMLVTSCLFLLVFAMTWGPCTAVLSMEISQADERILSCSVICGWVMNILVVSLFPLLVDQLGLGAMYIFLFCTVISIWVTRKDYSDK